MTETYQDIIDELTRKDFDTGASYVLAKDGVLTVEDVSYFTEAALDICKRVRDVVASDPSEWWVADVDGRHVHIYDHVEDVSGEVSMVAALADGDCNIWGEGRWIFGNEVRKVNDTREKIIKDAVDELLLIATDNKDQLNEIFGRAVDRAMKLGAEQ